MCGYIVEECDFGKYMNMPNPGFTSHTNNLIAGYPDDIRTPFWGGENTPRQDVVNAWRRVLLADEVMKSLPELLHYEVEQSELIGPWSIVRPLSRRWDTAYEYWTDVQSPGQPVSDRAISAWCDYLGDNVVKHLRAQRDVTLNMPLDTNSGPPFYGRRSRMLEKTVPCEIRDMEMIMAGHAWPLAAVAATRVQAHGPTPEDVRNRWVWNMPMALNICENQFYQPLTEHLQKTNLVTALVNERAVDAKITKAFKVKPPKQLVICTDFKGFDQHFNRHLQNAARGVYQTTCPTATSEEGWIDNVFPRKFDIPLIIGKNIIIGDHGMGSGSGGTNDDEDNAHATLQQEEALNAGEELNPEEDSEAYGDDGWLTHHHISVKRVCKSYEQHGQVMNPSKQYASDHDMIYLRRWHSTDYVIDGVMVGVYPTMRALNSLLGQERFYDPDKWGPRMVVLRALSIVENCKWHPLFERFVDFVEKGDKLRLGRAVPGFLEDIGEFARDAVTELHDFLGYNRTQWEKSTGEGIESWRVVQYLRSKGEVA